MITIKTDAKEVQVGDLIFVGNYKRHVSVISNQDGWVKFMWNGKYQAARQKTYERVVTKMSEVIR